MDEGVGTREEGLGFTTLFYVCTGKCYVCSRMVQEVCSRMLQTAERGLTRREDGFSRNRPRVVYHRVYFSIKTKRKTEKDKDGEGSGGSPWTSSRCLKVLKEERDVPRARQLLLLLYSCYRS